MDTTLSVAFGREITGAAARHHLDPRLLAAVAAQETGGPGADSGRNIVGDGGHGHGLFQIDDRWHAFARSPAAMDPTKNADYAAGMIAGNLGRYGGNVRAALSAYNAGSPNAAGTRTDWGDGKPVGYADSVMRHYARLAGSGTESSDPRDAAESVDALRTAAGELGTATGTGSGTDGQSTAQAQAAPMLMPLNLPAYKPLAPIDSRDRDVAPSVLDGDDSVD